VAELDSTSSTAAGRWTATQTQSQFAAIAWLRWRITVNSLRRKGGAGELIGRVVLYAFFGAIALFFVAGAGGAAFFMASEGHLAHIAWLLWATFLLCQFLNIQLGQPGTTFDPTQLIRFPMLLRTYTAVRLFFGVLSPANVVGTLMSLAMAVGVGIAVPSLWIEALLALAVFGAVNVLFSRMVFAWVDRWLSTRRAREIFTGLIFAVSIGIQWANFTFNPAYRPSHSRHPHGITPDHMRLISHFYHRAAPFLAVLPPELTTKALLEGHGGNVAGFLLSTLGCAVFAALFLFVFAMRMRTEFRGENLSDSASATAASDRRSSSPKLAPQAAPSHAAVGHSGVKHSATRGFNVPSVITCMMGKELLYLRRHMGVLYGLVMPILLVLIFAGRFSARSNSVWIFPAAVGYTLLAIAPLSYNSFGFEGTGSQLYFLAPVRMRDVLLAKNLFGFSMAMVEIAAVFAMITYIAGLPSLQTAVAAVLWAAGTLSINTVFGNQRSFTTPKKINPMRMANRQTSQVSAMMSLAILAVSAGVAAGLFLLCSTLRAMWALVPLAAIFAAAGIAAYLRSLRSADRFAMEHREELFGELCKGS
jgi:ABC-2 type transport system permease protein